MSILQYDGIVSERADTVLEFIKSIRGTGFRSNSMLRATEIQEKIEKGEAWARTGHKAAVVLIPDTESIVRLFYYAADKQALQEVHDQVSQLCVQNIVCDVLGREGKADIQVKELCDAGFISYARFQRMMCNCLKYDDSLDYSIVELAKQDDAQEILEITRQEFDPITAHMHSIEALQTSIMNKELLLVRMNGEIAGFTLFDSIGKRVALLDHVIVRPEYRKMKIAKTILAYKWKYMNDSQHYILWINTKCYGPIQYHEKNGFQKDGMYDDILLPQGLHFGG